MIEEKPAVLILGVTGLFGGFLAHRMVRENRFRVIGASRGIESLNQFKEDTDADIVCLDRADSEAIDKILTTYKPFAVVDCAGPFQFYGEEPYRFAKQVLLNGCHYIDIADASDFVAGIVELDRVAKQHSKAAVSGVSSTPAISAAVADELTQSMTEVLSIETAIIPGNRARRTLSVMKAILSQVGQPYQIIRHGQSEQVYGWSETRLVNLALPENAPVTNRLASLVHTPDDALFPERYGAQTVTLRAGLEIKWFHRTLEIFSRLVRWKLLPSIAPLTGIARWIASFFEHIGSDIGGMQVVVIGKTDENTIIKRTWDLVASDGRGPEIPTLPVSALLDKLYSGEVASGARASPGEISLHELNSRFEKLAIESKLTEGFLQPMFKFALGESFAQLPSAVQRLHSVTGRAVFQGRAQSMGPTGLSGRLIAWLFRFPRAAEDVPIRVTVTANEKSETWEREFAGTTFKSQLYSNSVGEVYERFGVISAKLGLEVLDSKLKFPVTSAKLFGFLPLPKVLLPISIAHESTDELGRFVFDVHLVSPFGARIAHYQGWLASKE